ncbi:MAG: type 2 isopentenyl-diphosphate Delta-isomerase [Proteobacteria bacterium]|nr:type 2 isopentenyl-diphosphate Delta-isomerase [Pseudomonadota bacterium]MCP4918962.1 type 2 isopentenyl-diphosphate Delta-isomerase [Pseudomonadota bacterium]
MSESGIKSRKADHIALCETDDVAFRKKTNGLDQVELIHDALPELAVDDIDLSTEYCGKTLRAPLVIAAMTGGTEQAEAINRDLAAMAEIYGIGFGFGSQRPLLTDGITVGYQVRDVAPTALILGNIGVVQAREATTSALARMLDQCGADALVVHLNPAMEVIQPGGDLDFRGGLDTIERLVRELHVPVIVKETGCGLSRHVGERVRSIGVRHVDTSGAGGTSWVGVETLRAQGAQATLGERFWDWGIPTAGSVAQLDGLDLAICATGGVSNGLMAARAIALGARCAGIARPFLQARSQGGTEGLDAMVRQVLAEIRLAHLLAGARTPDELRQKPILLGPGLARWIPRGTPLYDRALR